MPSSEHRQRVEAGADGEQPDLLDAGTDGVDARRAAAPAPAISPASTASSEHEHGSTVPSPPADRGPGRGPLPSGHGRRTASTALRYEVDGPVARLTIDREERRNALSWALVGELRRALASPRPTTPSASSCSPAPATVAFCAGADLEGMADGRRLHRAARGSGQLADLFRDLYALGKPTIARVQGFALAGGFGLALACDLVDRRRRRRLRHARDRSRASGRT